jgi:glycine dehydrogenase subunit 1
LHPHYRAVIETLSKYAAHEVVALPSGLEQAPASIIDGDTSCVVVQIPDIFGGVRDIGKLAEQAHAQGALLIVVTTEAVAYGAVRSPGSMGADIAVAEGQSIGNGLNFGGPYLGLFATRDKFVRQMPGRLCGETVDEAGKRGFVLTLSTREQHIRRDKATSNICTNSGLCSLAFTIHMTLLGEAGLKKLARVNHANAVKLAEALSRVPGVEVVTPHFFNEFTIRTPKPGAAVIDSLVDAGVIGGVPASRLFPDSPDLDRLIIVAATELTTPADREAYASALAKVLA